MSTSTYVNFAGMETASHRIKLYAESFDAYDGSMYQSTKESIMRTVSNLLDSLDMIQSKCKSKGIQVQFDNARSSNDDSVFNSLMNRVDQLEKMISKVTFRPGVPEVVVSETDTPESLDKNICETSSHVNKVGSSANSTEVEVNNQSSTLKKEVSKSNKKFMANIYKSFVDMPNDSYVSDIVEAKDCSELISYWLRKRFNRKTAPRRGYNISKMSDWIGAIIFAYGHACHEGSKIEFKEEFIDWCDNLTKDDPYVLPYKVFQFLKDDLDPGMVSPEGIGIAITIQYSPSYQKLVKKTSDDKLKFCHTSMLGSVLPFSRVLLSPDFASIEKSLVWTNKDYMKYMKSSEHKVFSTVESNNNYAQSLYNLHIR